MSLARPAILSVLMLSLMAISASGDGPGYCKSDVDRTPRLYSSADGKFSLRVLPKPTGPKTPEEYEDPYATKMIVFEPNPDGTDKVVSETVLKILPKRCLVSKKGDFVIFAHHGPPGDAGVELSIFDKAGKRRGATNVGDILGPLSGAERNQAWEALYDARGASFQYDWYSQDYLILPLSPSRTVRIALEGGAIVP